MANGPRVEIVTKNPDIVGECPVWDTNQSALLWTDNRSQRIYRWSLATRTVGTMIEGVAAYAFTLQMDGSLLLFLGNTRVAVARDGNVKPVIDGLPGEESARFNDVVVDSHGRVIGGVLPTDGRDTGALYGLSPGGLTTRAAATKLYDRVQLPNGMAFSSDERVLYVADTQAKHVLAFDYDVETGAATNPRTFIAFSTGEGKPDGITVDEEGCLWVATPGGGAVSRYGPDGTLLQRVPLPARKPTSVGFGGDELDTLFVTSSSRESTPGEELGLEAGALFAFKPGVRGILGHRTDWKE